MPDKVRSVDDMVADMERAVEEPEGNTSSGKHRQHVAQAIEKLISSDSSRPLRNRVHESARL